MNRGARHSSKKQPLGDQRFQPPKAKPWSSIKRLGQGLLDIASKHGTLTAAFTPEEKNSWFELVGEAVAQLPHGEPVTDENMLVMMREILNEKLAAYA